MGGTWRGGEVETCRVGRTGGEEKSWARSEIGATTNIVKGNGNESGGTHVEKMVEEGGKREKGGGR